MTTNNADASTPAESKQWWENNWASLGIGLALGVCLIVADDHGYGGVFEWGIAFVCGTGIAVAAFWARHEAPWFWPAVALLVVGHAVALATHHWRMMPHHATGTAIQLKGAAALDFGVSGLFLYCLHKLFDPATGPKAHWSAPAKVAASVLVLMVLGLAAFTATVIVQTHNKKIALSRTVFSARTDKSVDNLISCLDGYEGEDDEWDDVRGPYPGKQFFYEFSGRTEIIVDHGDFRAVQIKTVNGRQLRKEEMQPVTQCLS